jgi:hypothetical protein
MDILAYKNNIEKDYQTVAVIDWKIFEQQVNKRPEDYVFLLSSDEFNKFMELNQQIYKASKGEGFKINQDDYINKYQGVFVIVDLSIKPDFVKKYKVGYFTNDILGKTVAVFYINRSTNNNDKKKEILQRIIDYKQNTIRDDNKRN